MKTKRKGYSEDLKRWYRASLKRILAELEKTREEEYTHHFSNLDGCDFRGKDGRPHLRKCLWTLTESGYVEMIDKGFNTYKWKITKSGIKYLRKANL